MDMLDWWTVQGRTWGVENLDFKVELHLDSDLATKDYDGYSGADQIALERGAWHFVTVSVTPVGEDLVDHIGARQKLGAVEWGEMPDHRIDRDSLIDYPVKVLAEQAAIELLRWGFELKTTEGSDFAPEKLKAPF